MSIISIESFHKKGNEYYVTAVVDNMVLTHQQTYYEPPEYGPALCETSFVIDNEELAELVVSDDDYERIKFLEQLDLSWTLVDYSDEYFE
jgi:hypothetical protein